MDKLAAIRIYDGQNYSDEIPVTALAENVQWDESSTLIDILGSINLTRKGNIQDQIDELNNRINQETYSKPIDGIPKTDLANSVQISLGKADTALQSYTETDPTVPAWAKQPNKPTYTAQEVGALPADSQITVEVDDTLSIQGAAADAKAVGDALDSISTSVQNIWTGRCTDRFPTTTINKTVVLDNPEGFSLVNGVTIAIKYIGNAETVSNPCLNVNETGNIPVIAGDDSSFGNDKYYLRSWGDQGLHFFTYRALGNNPGKWYLTNVDTNMWINLIDDFSILQDANVATAQDLGKVPTVKVIRGGQVAEWQYKDITIDNTLSIQGAPADAKKVGNELVQIKQDLEIQQTRAETAQALKINKPITNPNGTQGQILQTDGQGGTSWVDGIADEQIAYAVTDWLDDHVTPGGSTIVVDDTLSIQGAAADAKKVGDEIRQHSGLTDDIRQALLQIAEKVAYIDDDGQDYYDALESALYPPADLVSISAVYTQSGTVYDTDTLDSLKTDLTVTATYSDQTTETVTAYTLSGTLTVGTSTITVTYGGKTTTFSVTVTENRQIPTSYTWLYDARQGELLSERTDLVTPTIQSGCTEILVDGLLHLFVPRGSSNFIRYKLVQETNTNAKLTAKVKFESINYAVAGTAFRLQVSNGTNGAQIFERYNNSSSYKFGTFEGTTYTEQLSLELNTWYIISVELNNGKQIVTVDGNEILNSSTLSSNYCTSNAIFVQNAGGTHSVYDTNVDIEWITYKNND